MGIEMPKGLIFILLFIIASLVTLNTSSRATEVEIYLRESSFHWRAIFFATVLQSKYIHAGLKVGKWAISAGPNGIDLKSANFDNAIYVETNKESSVGRIYKQAVGLFNKFGFASYGDYLKVFFNKVFNTSFKIHGMTCSAFVARMLNMENPENKIPSDFLKTQR